MIRRSLSAVLLLLAALAIARGEDRASLAVLPGEVAATARRLVAADKLAAQKQWNDAIDEYQRILSESGDDLVPLTPRHLVQARWLCHQRLAALPPEQLTTYRKRIEPQARKWFEQGSAARDERLLRRVVDEAFCSQHALRALDILGDLAFERGDFGEAERCWRYIVRPADEKRKDGEAIGPFAQLVCPDPHADVARIRAKIFLARLFRSQGQDSRSRLDEELTTFRAQHAKAEGRLAGRQGNYADTLQALLNESPPPRPADETVVWPTFAADPGRTSTVSGAARRLQRICLQPPQWRFSLEHHTRLEGDPPAKPTDKPLTPSARNRAMAFHPVIVGDNVLVADARAIVAYSLAKGTPSVWFEKDAPENLLSLKLPAPADLRYTLTVAEDRVFARLGVQDLNPERDGRESPSYLVCLNLKPGDTEKRWQVTPDEPSRGAVFEGSPVVKDGRVLIAATRVEGGQTITAIQCYPAHAERMPQAIWRRDVCSTSELHGNARRLRHHLLTVAGSLVIYASHSGAIVALDAQTGRHVWAVRYPSQGGTTTSADGSEAVHWTRDLAPCVHAAGRLYVAQADYDHVLCLEPATGNVLWERGEIKVVHLLGVAHDRLIFTLPHGIRAVDAGTGADIWQMPDLGTALKPVGRGFLADDLVFWPTSMGLKVLQVDDGQQSRSFPPGVLDAKLPPERLGNMVYANGCLAVAGLEELDIYLGAAYQRAEREADVRAFPNAALARYRLALSEADAGSLRLAVENLRRAEKLAGTEQATLAAQAQAARFELQLETAAQAAARRDWQHAAAELEDAASLEFPTTKRAQALTRLAELWTLARQPARAVAAWQRILDDSNLRTCRVEDHNSNPQQAATLARASKNLAIAKPGDKVYSDGEHLTPKRFETEDQDHPDALRRWPIPPLLRDWEISLEPDERLLLPDGPETNSLSDGFLFFGAPAAAGGRLICRETTTGKPLWTTAMPFVPDWTGCHEDMILAGGSGGLASLRIADGEMLWHFPALAPLNAFRLPGPQLFFLEGGRRLFALDAETGEVLWSRWAPAARLGLPEPSGKFNPHYFAGQNRVLIQTTGGRRWLLDAKKGQTLQDIETGTQQWAQPPLAINNGRILPDSFCLAAEPDRIVRIGADGKQLWSYELGHRMALTGELPQLVGVPIALAYVLIPRNYGTALRQLSTTGYSPWIEERLLTTNHLSADEVAFDGRALYYVSDNILYAHALADGMTLWNLPLSGPQGHWRVMLAGQNLMVWPLDVPPGDSSRLFSVILCRSETGRLVQRLNLTPITRKLPARNLPTVHVSIRGMIVAIPGTACRFVAATK
jgi:outer membrane protein assembly factor BamB